MKKIKPELKVIGIDISEKAIKLAQENAIEILGGNTENIEFLKFNALNLTEIRKNLNKEKFDIIISNPPYIGLKEKGKMSLEPGYMSLK